jgi:hypothetical protein
MYAAVAVVHASNLTFGRGTAQFKELVAFMAVVSIVSWSLVIITTFLRWWIGRFWYRRAPAENINNLSP